MLQRKGLDFLLHQYVGNMLLALVFGVLLLSLRASWRKRGGASAATSH
ncbi:hypothetical protein AB9K34_05780 [Sedimentitalea sp. XS_ASV28]